MSEPAPNDTTVQLKRLFALIAPHRGRFVLATLMLLVGSAISLLYPQAARLAVDLGIAEGGSPERLNTISLALLGAFAVQAVVVWVRHYIMSWLGERVVADLRNQVFTRLVSLPPGWFHERRTGELVGRLASDVTVIEGVVGSELSIALRNFVQLIAGVVLLFIENAKLTLLMLAVVPPLSLGVVFFGRMIRKMSRALQDRLAETSGHVDEVVGAIQTVQAFVQEDRERRAYAEKVEDAFGEALHLTKWRASFMSTVTFAGSGALVAIVWVGGRAVIDGTLTPGDLVAFLLYTLMVATSLGSVAGVWSSVQRAVGATDRLFSVIETVPEIRDPDSAATMPSGEGEVRFEAVTFRYPARRDVDVIKRLDLTLPPGEVTAVVGSSGAGKSTMTALLLRFFDVSEGTIAVDGVDIRKLALKDLRSQMAIVAQDPALFSGTIRDNIAYGVEDTTDDAVIAAAKDAHADRFIREFPDGYDTLIGERGVKLSGGQRQRIAIARAILKNPRILILDEATSNLDAESESLVQEALARLMKGRTTMVIAHRLSTVRDADRIVVLDHGVVVQQGRHDELMAEGGTYKKLVEHQLVGLTDAA